MTIDVAQKKFYELQEEWDSYHQAASKLRAAVNQAFAEVAKSSFSSNPTQGVLMLLDSLEAKEATLRAKMDELIASLG